jgi:hypothetical protein
VETFTDTLRSFDSHERGILLQWVTGRPFALSPDLRRQLDKELGLSVPESAYVAMDYALDWLGAAVKCHADPLNRERAHARLDGFVTGSSEDIDLLIAWEDEKPHLVLVEAKGFTGWTNKQMASKAKRLAALFGALDATDVDLHFVLVGPRRATKLDFSEWPAWMRREDKVVFLTLPSPGDRWSVERGIDSDGWATTQHEWKHWRLKRRRWPQAR